MLLTTTVWHQELFSMIRTCHDDFLPMSGSSGVNCQRSLLDRVASRTGFRVEPFQMHTYLCPQVPNLCTVCFEIFENVQRCFGFVGRYEDGLGRRWVATYWACLLSWPPTGIHCFSQHLKSANHDVYDVESEFTHPHCFPL